MHIVIGSEPEKPETNGNNAKINDIIRAQNVFLKEMESGIPRAAPQEARKISHN